MKYKVLKKLVQFRHWANTPIGERTIVNVLTIATIILIIDVALLATIF